MLASLGEIKPRYIKSYGDGLPFPPPGKSTSTQNKSIQSNTCELSEDSPKGHVSHKEKPSTFHYTGWLSGILIMVYYNPHITG